MPQIIFVEPDAACRAVPAHPSESRMAAAYAKVARNVLQVAPR